MGSARWLLPSARFPLCQSVEQELLQLLLDLDQRHLFEAWPAGDAQAAEKHRFLRQVAVLQETLPGGLAAYYENAKVLLQESSSHELTI